jgi:hypothetical protein
MSAREKTAGPEPPRPPWGGREAELVALALGVSLAAGPLIPGPAIVKVLVAVVIFAVSVRAVAINPRGLVAVVRAWVDWRPRLRAEVLALAFAPVALVGLAVASAAFLTDAGRSESVALALLVAGLVSASVGAVELALEYGTFSLGRVDRHIAGPPLGTDIVGCTRRWSQLSQVSLSTPSRLASLPS